MGIGAEPRPDGPPGATTLSVSEVAISGTGETGLLTWSAATATVERSVVRDTRATTRGWGDGITTGGRGSLTLSDSLVERSARAGLIFYGGGGSVRRSVFRKGVFAIDLEEAATPEIGDDNGFEDNKENRVTWGNKLAPSAVPQIPTPLP